MISVSELYEKYLRHPLVSTDSRNILPGSIFFSLKGPTFDGNSFAAKALESGAAYAVIDNDSFNKGTGYLMVKDALQALQDLANFHRHRLKIPFLAITGSNGKTTTKELIRNVLSKKFRTHATKGNLNNHIGVPLTILSIGNDVEFAVIEMGANHQQEIAGYCRIAEPDYGMITNVGKAHLEGFGGFEGVKKGKGELYEWISDRGKAVFINGDNSELMGMAGRLSFNEKVLYGSTDDFYCTGAQSGEQAGLSVTWKCGKSSGRTSSGLVGSYNFENILSAICIGNYFGVEASSIDAAIREYVPDNSRSQLLRKGSNTIVLDAYNANPTSMEAALNNFSRMNAKKKIALIGDMAELGEESDHEHERILSIARSLGFDSLVLVGERFGRLQAIKGEIHFKNSTELATWLRSNPLEDALVLIKGSRSTKMEVVLDSF